jgi:hypothetical protein
MREKLWEFFTVINCNLGPLYFPHSAHSAFNCPESVDTHLQWDSFHSIDYAFLQIQKWPLWSPPGPLHSPRLRSTRGLNKKILEAVQWASLFIREGSVQKLSDN